MQQREWTHDRRVHARGPNLQPADHKAHEPTTGQTCLTCVWLFQIVNKHLFDLISFLTYGRQISGQEFVAPIVSDNFHYKKKLIRLFIPPISPFRHYLDILFRLQDDWKWIPVFMWGFPPLEMIARGKSFQINRNTANGEKNWMSYAIRRHGNKLLRWHDH